MALDRSVRRRTVFARWRSRHVLALAASAASACWLGCVAARDAAPGPRQAPDAPATAAGSPVLGELMFGESVTREMAVGGIDTFAIQIAAERQYLRVAIARHRSTLRAAVLSPEGEVLAEAGQGPRRALRLASLVTTGPAELRLRVSAPPDMTEAEGYAVWIDELRPATETDGRRVEAEALFALALEDLEANTAEATDSALARLREALAAWREIGDRRGAADALHHIGYIELDRQPKEGFRYLEEGLTEAEAAGYAAGRAAILNSLGVGLLRSEPQVARLRLEAALRIWQELGIRDEEGTTLFNLGYLHFISNDPSAALDHYERALPLVREGGDRSVESRVLTSIGLIHSRLGDPDRALEFFDQALPLSRAAGDILSESNLSNQIANVLRRRGEVQRALELHTEALESFRRAENRGLQASTHHSLGALYYELGDLDRALTHCTEARRLYRETGNRRFETLPLVTLGWIHYQRGDTAAALVQHQEALTIARSQDPPDRRMEAAALHGIGAVHLARGETGAAIEALGRALALRRETKIKAEVAIAELDLGTAYLRAGETALAADHLERARSLAEATGYLNVKALYLLRRAEIERDAGRLADGVRLAQEAVAIVESVRSRVAGPSLRTSLLGTRRPFYELLFDLHMRLDAVEPGAGHAARALRVCERSRARGLLELIVEGRLQLDRDVSPALHQREVELDRRTAWAQSQLLDALARTPRDDGQIAALEAELRQVDEARGPLEWEIRGRHPGYAALRYPEPPLLAEITAQLDADSALLEYCTGNERSYVFVVDERGLAAFPLPPAEQLESAVRDLWDVLHEPATASRGRYAQIARGLYRRLVEPAEPALRGKTRLLVSPDGPLHLLPFEALLTTAPGHLSLSRLPYLIAERSVAYIPSATVLASLRQPGASPRSAGSGPELVAFAAAAPRKGDGPAEHSASRPPSFLAELLTATGIPAARREVLEIAGLFPSAATRLYLDDEAIEENVKGNDALAGARRLHFAAHGFVDQEQPLRSGLYLNRRAGSAEDGLLQMYEVFNLRLTADSVVLSACDTGAGKQVSGEGLITLARAFFHAGARSLLVSLWPVRDDSTRFLMVRFYDALHAGEGHSEALRAAKLDMIHTGRFAHPSYWAPFVLLGEAGEAKEQTTVTTHATGRQ